ncbi:DUF4435 domain-containing protein [Sphingomonas sp.]|uniref:DUF4435 domain-containing protein n=1 Tax=Sphingomonas sp. TaxID=28214 RepID=UPI003AFFBDD4
MSRHIRPSDISAQLRMERQRHRGVFALVEGATDIRRFRKFFDPQSCSFVNCFGKDNVIGAIDIEQNSGRCDSLGFADADFDRVLGNHVENGDIIHSAHHDFDTDVCATSAMHRYLDEMGEEQKIVNRGGKIAVIEQLLATLKPLSAMRFANQKHLLAYSFDKIDVSQFFDGGDLDIDKMIDHVSTGRFVTDQHKTALRGFVDRYTAAEIDLWQFTNGHDLIEALGIALRDRLGCRRPPQTWRSEVEKHLRLTFDASDLQECGLKSMVETWEVRTGQRVMAVR